MKQHFYITFLVILISSLCLSQETKLKGKIIDNDTKKPLISAHILNLNSVVGTITNDEGFFNVTSKVNDTILISHLGYESIKLKVTNDLLKVNKLTISLNEKPEEVKEVVVASTKLIGVLEVDVKQVPKDKFTRIHLNGLPQTYEIGRPQKISSPISKLFNPVDLVYSLFGKKPRELRKLKKLKEQDGLRKMMSKNFNREALMEYLGMDKQQLMDLLSYCNYSEYFTKKASDLQMIEAVLNCYENYKAIQKGKINIDRIPKKTNHK
ncbi:MAG: carboxypeptidase-like regulatory domain-containing protein [Tenacibaculum sp.]|nr:carboxypeptidase-like regulatory domain-containing protein [Tenacibaculum sp.]